MGRPGNEPDSITLKYKETPSRPMRKTDLIEEWDKPPESKHCSLEPSTHFGLATREAEAHQYPGVRDDRRI